MMHRQPANSLLKLATTWAFLIVVTAACKTRPEPILLDKTFDYQLRSDNQFWVTLGEHFPDGHKQGQWRQFDVYGRISAVETYQTDTLKGPAIYFHYENEGQPSKEQGPMHQGKKVGVWEIWNGKGQVDQQGRCKWHQVAKVIYDDSGLMIAQLTLFPDGKIASQQTFGPKGEQIYFRQFNRCGKVIAEGKEPSTVLETL